jgi:hypothetical protein
VGIKEKTKVLEKSKKVKNWSHFRIEKSCHKDLTKVSIAIQEEVSTKKQLLFQVLQWLLNQQFVLTSLKIGDKSLMF